MNIKITYFTSAKIVGEKNLARREKYLRIDPKDVDDLLQGFIGWFVKISLQFSDHLLRGPKLNRKFLLAEPQGISQLPYGFSY